MPLRQQGFSLIEILVAFSILALAMGVLMQIFSTGLRNTELSRDYAVAAALAQSLLASTGTAIPLTAGEDHGTHADKFRWVLSMRPAEESVQLGAGATITQTTSLHLMQIRAHIEWGGNQGTPVRTIALDTLRVFTVNP